MTADENPNTVKISQTAESFIEPDVQGEQIFRTSVVMKCYALLGVRHFEGSTLLGVYWTEHAAEQARDTVRRAQSSFSDFVIEEHELQG